MEENVCLKCGSSSKKGVTVHNTPENCKERLTFPYMQIGDVMHLECYIQHVIDTIMAKKMEKMRITPHPP